MKEGPYLFAYGTLRRDHDPNVLDQLIPGITGIGKGRIMGSLYDLGNYPGAVRDPGGKEILGDVYMIWPEDKVLALLDEYEGFSESRISNSEFVRKKDRVKLDSGDWLLAWIYWYNLNPDGKMKIDHTDYLEYLKKRRQPNSYGTL
jgi:gamma-glutamylcyclotransferase (GGCT)/AIG2-like uncharacterized protein YtfP